MNTSALGNDIKRMHDMGCSCAEIAESLELEPVLVESVLMSFGLGGKEKEGVEELVSKDEIHEFVSAYKNIARYAEEPHIKEKALRHLINLGRNVTDGLGESSVKNLMKEAGANCNILNLNAIILSAREAKKMAVEGVKKITGDSGSKEVNGSEIEI